MKLIIKRDQKAQTGILGGHKGMTFVLSCKVELTPTEGELIDKYKAKGYPLTWKTDKGVDIPSTTTLQEIPVTFSCVFEFYAYRM